MSPNVAASVRERLLNQARAKREEFERTLVRYADERLLYRLGASKARDRCVVKGASLLTVWMRDPYRATRDVDVLASGSPNENTIREIIKDICQVPCPEDGIMFDLSDLLVEDIRAAEEYFGKRARFIAALGSARTRVQMDFGFGDALVSAPEEVDFPTMLTTVPAPRVRAYPREATVAEKFQAMVTLDIRNSRLKDFHDVWALSNAFAFEGRTLRRAVAACFERRGTPLAAETPRALTAAFYEMPEIAARWRGYLTAGGVLVAPPSQFEAIGEQIITFLGPVRDAIIANDDLNDEWPAGGPWREQS